MHKIKKTAVILMIFVLPTIAIGQEKEFKKVKELIDKNLKETVNSNDFITTIRKIFTLSQDLKGNYPESPLGYYASSFYFERTNINVDSAFFQMKIANDQFNKLDEKNQQKLCDKFNLCKETFTNNLDSLSVISLANYCSNQRSDEVKKFLNKYPQGFESYNIALQIYEKLRFTEILQSNDLNLYSKFFIEFPNSKYSDSLNAKIEQIEYNVLSRSTNRVDFENYLIKHPNSIYKIQILENIEILKQKEITSSFEKCKDGLCLIEFLKKYPKSNFTNEAVEKIFLEVKIQFEYGHQDILKNLYKLKEIEDLEFDKQKLDNVIQNYSFKIVLKFDNNYDAWDQYIKVFPNSPKVSEAIQFRDSLMYLDVLKHNSKEMYSKFIQLYPNSKYADDAQEQINKLQEVQKNINTSEKLFLQRYAIYEKKLVRLFVNTDDRVFNNKSENIRISKSDDLFDYNDLWESYGSAEVNFARGHIKRDSITYIQVLESKDWGENYDEENYWKSNLENDDLNIITNYITLDTIQDKFNNVLYVTGFFVNKKHYVKDLDIFIAKIDLTQKDLNKKVIWLKEFGSKNTEDNHLNDWGLNLIKNDEGGVILLGSNSIKENRIISVNTSGDLLWDKKLPANCCKYEVLNYATKLKRLNNGDFLIGYSQYFDRKATTLVFYETGSPLGLESYDNSGNLIFKNFSIGFKATGEFGGILEKDKSIYVVINYYRYIDNQENTIYSKAKGGNFTRPNVMLLKFDHKGTLINSKILASDEPRFIKTVNIFEENKIKMVGIKGKKLDEYLYHIIDENLNVLESNGME